MHCGACVQQEPPKQPETDKAQEHAVAKSQMTKPLAPIESGVEECDLCGRSAFLRFFPRYAVCDVTPSEPPCFFDAHTLLSPVLSTTMLSSACTMRT
jgi:hypothetical protein